MKILALLLITIVVQTNAYRTHDKSIERAKKSLTKQQSVYDESFWEKVNDDDESPNIDLDEFDYGEIPDNAYGLRLRRIRIRGRRIIDEVRRPIRQVERIARRVIIDPVVRVVREAGRGLVRLVPIVRNIRFHRRSGPVVVPTNPPTKAQCRVPNGRCPSSWDVFDREYQILDEIFKVPCQKYDLCNVCATQRSWSHQSCLSRLLSDMKAMCVPYTGEENTVCNQEASKFHSLATMGHKPVNPSPGYCVDGCVNQRGNPVVELSTS